MNSALHNRIFPPFILLTLICLQRGNHNCKRHGLAGHRNKISGRSTFFPEFQFGLHKQGFRAQVFLFRAQVFLSAMEMPEDSPVKKPKILSLWPSYSGRYQRLHGSEKQKPKRVRRRPAIRLGRRRRVLFVRLYQRFRFRAFTKYSLAFVYKKLKSLYETVIEELKEAGPGLEAINSSALINAHFSIASLPSSVSSMASMAF